MDIEGAAGGGDSEGEHDVFGHGGNLDEEEGVRGMTDERRNEAGDGEGDTSAEGWRSTVVNRDSRGQETRRRGNTVIDEVREEIRICGEAGVSTTVCQLAEAARGSRRGSYAAEIGGGHIRIVFTSAVDADSFMTRCMEARVVCAQCEGDVAAGRTVKRQGCGHPVCGACFAENRDGTGEAAMVWGRAAAIERECTRCRTKREGEAGLVPAERGRPKRLRTGSADGPEPSSADTQDCRRKRGHDQGEDRDEGGRRATAAERIADLRARVRNRQASRAGGVSSAPTGGGEGGRGDQTDAGEGPPAPATPVDHRDVEGCGDGVWMWMAQGCGCKGRLHYECAWKRVRRAKLGAGSSQEAVEGQASGKHAEASGQGMAASEGGTDDGSGGSGLGEGGAAAAGDAAAPRCNPCKGEVGTPTEPRAHGTEEMGSANKDRLRATARASAHSHHHCLPVRVPVREEAEEREQEKRGGREESRDGKEAEGQEDSGEGNEQGAREERRDCRNKQHGQGRKEDGECDGRQNGREDWIQRQRRDSRRKRGRQQEERDAESEAERERRRNRQPQEGKQQRERGRQEGGEDLNEEEEREHGGDGDGSVCVRVSASHQHRHPQHRQGEHGEQRREAEPVRGSHRVLAQRNNWGGDSWCSAYPPEVQPPTTQWRQGWWGHCHA